MQAASEGIPIVLLYPGVIYGPGKLTAGNIVAQIVSHSLFQDPKHANWNK